MRQLILTLLLLAGVGSAFTQNLTSAFFVFRNDGPVLPFFYEDVDSIRQSKIDTDSIERPEFVTTEFWTSDSVYRVPIASIDSIAFRTPSEIRKPRSKEISDELLSYLVAVDSLTLKFSPSVPKSILPEKGDKLTYLNVMNLLPNGFLGEVRNVNVTDSNILVICDSIGISEAYSRLFKVMEYRSPKNISRTTSNGVQTIDFSIHYPLLFDENYFVDFSLLKEDYAFGFNSNKVNLYFDVDVLGKYTIIKEDHTWEPSYYIKFNGDANVAIDLELDSYFNFDLLSEYIPEEYRDIPIPTPGCPALFTVIFRPEASVSGSIIVAGTWKYSLGMGFECRYSTESNIGNFIHINQITPLKSNLDKIDFFGTDMSLSAGGYLALRVGVPKMAVCYIGAAAGLSLKSSFLIGKNEFKKALYSNLLYDKINFSNSLVTLSAYVEPRGEVKLFNIFEGKIGKTYSVDILSIPSKKLFPDFKDLKYVENGAETHLECNAEGLMYFPVYLGIKVVDDNNKEVFKEFNDKMHMIGSTHVEFPYLHKTFNKPCTAYPVFKIFDREITASPSLDLNLKATPVTDDAFAGSTDATLQGHLEMNSSTLLNITAVDYTVGFCYSTSSGNVKGGKVVECQLRTDRTFEVNISGLNEDTDYYYCAFITTDTITEYGEVRHFYTKEAEEIDLGLSVNWRAWNVGANHSYEYGNHYAWGEKNVKGEYSWSSYFDNPYNGKEWIGCSVDTDISGVYERDASKDLGEDWRMPTREEMQELLDKCEWEWHTVGGVDGYKVTGPSRRSIFLPANGLIDGSSLNNTGTYGAYWTSTPQADTEGKATAATLYFYGGMLKSLQWANRYAGRAVRPVRDKQ